MADEWSQYIVQKPSTKTVTNTTPKNPVSKSTQADDWSQYLVKKDTGISGQEIVQHPFKSIAKTIMQPAEKSLTGRTIEDKTRSSLLKQAGNTNFKGKSADEVKNELGDIEDAAFKKTLLAQGLDMATTPSNYVGAGLVKGAAGVVKGTVQSIGKFIPETIKRGAADYLTNNVAPKVHQLYQYAVAKFTPEIEKFARDKNIPESAIRTIKTHGPQAIEQTKDSLGNYSTDEISQKINQGIAAKDKEVNDAYQAATAGAKQNKLVIPLTRTKRTIAAILRNHGYLDAANKETAMAENDLVQNSPLKNLLGYYKGLNPKTDAGVNMVNTYQWNDLRNNLSKLRRQDKSLQIKSVLDALHSDAERAGLKGIKEARVLAAKNFDAEENILSSNLLKEGKLDKYHTLPEAEKRKLKSVEQYINVPFTKDLEKISSGKYLDKIQEGKSLKDFQNLLNQAVDKKWTVSKQKELESMVGKQNADKIIREVISHRRAITTKNVAKIVGGGAAGAVGAGAIYGAGKEMLGQ